MRTGERGGGGVLRKFLTIVFSATYLPGSLVPPVWYCRWSRRAFDPQPGTFARLRFPSHMSSAVLHGRVASYLHSKIYVNFTQRKAAAVCAVAGTAFLGCCARGKKKRFLSQPARLPGGAHLSMDSLLLLVTVLHGAVSRVGEGVTLDCALSAFVRLCIRPSRLQPKTAISAMSFHTVVHIPTRAVGAVIGRGGSIVTGIRSRSGCSVSVQQDRGEWRGPLHLTQTPLGHARAVAVTCCESLTLIAH